MHVVLALAMISLGGCSSGDDPGAGDKTKPVDTGGPGGELPQVYINEFMASNLTTLADETGAYPDWIELYNPGDADADLAGWWLTDELSDPFKWQIPEGISVPAKGYLVVYADSDTEEGPRHASFNLDAAGGEDIGLFGPNVLDNPLVDSIEAYEILIEDVSLARLPDGGPTWERVATPTPEAPNN